FAKTQRGILRLRARWLSFADRNHRKMDYVRLHGPTQSKYQGSYSDAQLENWARRIEEWRRTLDAVYVYFDNDDSAYAVNNALTLKRLVSASSRPRRAVREPAEASNRSR